LFKQSKHLWAASALAVASAAVVGCEIRAYGPPPPPPTYVEVAPAPAPAPVVVDGGVYVDVLPPPDQRVYYYDPGYPPGCFFYGGYYYYGGYRYSRDVFINRVVNVNIHENRYVNVEENHRQGEAVKVRQQADYARYGGHVRPAGDRPPAHREDEHHDAPPHGY
jgi:hypothetical protein